MMSLKPSKWKLDNKIISKRRLVRLLTAATGDPEDETSNYLDALIAKHGRVVDDPGYDHDGYPLPDYDDIPHDPESRLELASKMPLGFLRYYKHNVNENSALYEPPLSIEEQRTPNTRPPASISFLRDTFLLLEDVEEILSNESDINLNSVLLNAHKKGFFDHETEETEALPQSLDEAKKIIFDAVHSECLKKAIEVYFKYWHPICEGKETTNEMRALTKKEHQYEVVQDDYENLKNYPAKCIAYVAVPNDYRGKSK